MLKLYENYTNCGKSITIIKINSKIVFKEELNSVCKANIAFFAEINIILKVSTIM